jgi:hypothetical protein
MGKDKYITRCRLLSLTTSVALAFAIWGVGELKHFLWGSIDRNTGKYATLIPMIAAIDAQTPKSSRLVMNAFYPTHDRPVAVEMVLRRFKRIFPVSQVVMQNDVNNQDIKKNSLIVQRNISRRKIKPWLFWRNSL